VKFSFKFKIQASSPSELNALWAISIVRRFLSAYSASAYCWASM